jgi:hypothetical protein
MKARWSLLIPAGALLVLVLAVAAAFVQVHRARTRAGRYLVFILPLRIGSTYDIVVRQLRDADIPTTLPSECHTECGIELRFLNTLQTGLHLAPPTALVGDLSFRDGKLVQKTTVLGGHNPYLASVSEYSGAVSEVRKHQNQVIVSLAPSDFTDFRRQAYAFNLMCIGSMKGCTTDEYLPTVNVLEHGAGPR